MRNPPVTDSPFSIVFICKGNICRSAFAERLTCMFIANMAWERNLRISSAGLKAKPGSLPPERAANVAKEFGVELAGHRSKVLTDQMVNSADMIIAMEPGQVADIKHKYTHRRDNVFLLPLFENGTPLRRFGYERYHIQDPYGKDREAFVKSFEQVQACVQSLCERLYKSGSISVKG